jgi:two-component system, NtrC family, sensor kinase
MLDVHAETLSVIDWSKPTRAVAGPAWTAARNRRLLVVEDDPAIRSALRDLLIDLGHAVFCCEDGRQALETLASIDPPPEIILLDLMLPVMDGWEFRVHQRANSRLAGIPVLAISADPSPKAAAIDADGFLRKPFRAHDVERELAGIEGKLERAEHTQALIAMGTVVASVAHELKNPLTYVLGNIDFASRTASEIAGRCQSLRGASQPASEVCDSLLTGLGDFEKATAEAKVGLDRIVALTQDLGNLGRKHQLRRERFALKAALESAIQITAHKIRGQATLLREYFANPIVVGDCPRLSQVFVNLLVNASHAVAQSSGRSKRIRVRIRVLNGSAVAEVEDTGVGIAPELAAHVFEPYFSTKPAGEGSGLGLPISREIVVAHGGTLDFVSHPGQGSRFRVTLPLTPAADSSAAVL